MQYTVLCDYYEQIQQTSKRLEKTRILAELFAQAGQHLQPVALLVQGQVRPAWQRDTMGISAKLMLQAISQVTGTSKKELNELLKEHGDLGLVSEQTNNNRKQQTLLQKTLSVKYVHEQLQKLATITGTGSVGQKIKIISELLSHANPLEARYVTRTVLEQLRIGIATGTLRDALIYAFLSEEAGIIDGEIVEREQYNEISSIVQSAYDKTNDFAAVAQAARTSTQALTEVRMQLGVPLKVMLGIRGADTNQAFNDLGTPLLLQYKYDGFRVQIHKNHDKIQIFTRRLEDVTEQFPDIVKNAQESIKATECILDAEAIGIDPNTRNYRPFQEISQRIRRKYGINEMAQKLPVDVRVFDIMYKDGEELLKEPLNTRHEKLTETINEQELFGVAQTLITTDQQEAQEFFVQARAYGTEGLFAKKTDSEYQPGTRVGNWMKLKDTMEPLDVVIVGAEWGEGKRSGWLTSFSIAIQDELGELLEIGKVGTGLKELPEEGFSFPEITELLREHIIAEDAQNVRIEPAIIIEVAYEEIQKSPSYQSGYALRFPRILRDRSDERAVDDISTLPYVEHLYRLQKE